MCPKPSIPLIANDASLMFRGKQKKSAAHSPPGWHGGFLKMLFMLRRSDVRKYNAVQGRTAQSVWATAQLLKPGHNCWEAYSSQSFLSLQLNTGPSVSAALRRSCPPVVSSDSWANTSTCLVKKILWDVSCVEAYISKSVYLKKAIYHTRRQEDKYIASTSVIFTSACQIYL